MLGKDKGKSCTESLVTELKSLKIMCRIELSESQKQNRQFIFRYLDLRLMVQIRIRPEPMQELGPEETKSSSESRFHMPERPQMQSYDKN